MSLVNLLITIRHNPFSQTTVNKNDQVATIDKGKRRRNALRVCKFLFQFNGQLLESITEMVVPSLEFLLHIDSFEFETNNQSIKF